MEGILISSLFLFLAFLIKIIIVLSLLFDISYYPWILFLVILDIISLVFLYDLFEKILNTFFEELSVVLPPQKLKKLFKKCLRYLHKSI